MDENAPKQREGNILTILSWLRNVVLNNWKGEQCSCSKKSIFRYMSIVVLCYHLKGAILAEATNIRSAYFWGADDYFDMPSSIYDSIRPHKIDYLVYGFPPPLKKIG